MKVDPVAAVTKFAAFAAHSTHVVDVGIDPGSTGAIGFSCGKVHVVIDIPTIETKIKRRKRMTFKAWARQSGTKSYAVWKKATDKYHTVLCTSKAFDYDKICELFSLFDGMRKRVRVTLEKIPPSIGPGRKYAEIMLNRAYMLWPLFVVSKKFGKFQEVRPGEWKKALGLLGKEKSDSLVMARKAFPSASLARVKDHDRAEALLLIKYATTHT